MSDSSCPPAAVLPETTFRSYTNEQGTNYAQHRRGYHPDLYKTIIDHHTSTGGQLDTIVDVGCGPGTAVHALAPHFNHAIGIEPSEGMITAARSLGGVSSTSEPIRFEVSTAEDIGSQLSPPIADSSVDLITAATAAHWFDMTGFWPRAAQVLKPGGTVALWTSSYLRFDPSTPNHAAVQATVDFHEELLKDYMVPGNVLTRNLYIDLPLPWTLSTPVLDFDQNAFVRKEWNTANTSGPQDKFFVGEGQGIDLDTLEKMLGTTSPVARWREAHPEARSTEDDVVRIVRRHIEKLLHEAGVEKGKEILRGRAAAVLLIVKKKA